MATATRNGRPSHRAAPQGAPAPTAAALRRQNFTENPDSYTLEVVAPGFSRDELVLQILHHQRMVTLNGERAGEEGSQVRNKISRRWRLPLQADVNRVSATLRDGLLHVTFAKCNALTNVVTVRID